MAKKPRPAAYGAITVAAKRKGQTPQAEWARQQIAAGKCAQGCGRRIAGTSARYCAQCLSAGAAHSRAHVATRREQGLCRCGEPLGDFARCAACRERENRARRKH